IRIAGVQWCTNAREHQESREVRLIEHVKVGKSREISAVTPIAELRIDLVSQTGVNAVLDIQPLGEVGPIVDVRQISNLLLVDWLRAEEGGLKEELGDVRPERFAREGAPEEQIRRHLAAAVAWTQVGRLRPEFRRCLSGYGVRKIIRERNIAQ